MTESMLQNSIIQWVDYTNPNCFVFAVPNGGLRNKFEAFNLKRQGVRPGVSDLVVMLPKGRISFVELKSITGKQSPHQKNFQQICEKFGHDYSVCRSLDEFMKLVKPK